MMRSSRTFPPPLLLPLLLALVALPAHAQMASHAAAPRAEAPARKPALAQLLLGRNLVLNHDCMGCHGGAGPDDPKFLGGMQSPDQEFLIGPCAQNSSAKPCWRTRPRNITPDNATGIGRFSERQIFNALRYGLRPGETPDVVITGTTPGQGNFPATPRYLAPPMPWAGWRHMSDRELWAIAAYLKHAVKPIVNRVADSEGPPDFWASTYVAANVGTWPAPKFPAASERMP